MAEGPKLGEGQAAGGGETGDPVAAGSPRRVVALSLVSSVNQPAVIVRNKGSFPFIGIEGTQASLVDLLAYEAGDSPGGSAKSTDDVEEVSNHLKGVRQQTAW